MVGHIDKSAGYSRWVKCFKRRLVGISHPRQHVHYQRLHKACHNCADTQLRSEKEQGQEHQRDFKTIAECAHLHRREYVVEHNAGSINTARDDIVRVDKKHEAGTHCRTSNKNQNPRFDFLQ